METRGRRIHRTGGTVVGVGLHVLHLAHHAHSTYHLSWSARLGAGGTARRAIRTGWGVNNLAKYDVLAVEVLGIIKGYEKLGAVRVWSAIGHTQEPRFIMENAKTGGFVIEFGSIDRFSPCSITSAKIPSLAHKSRDYAMERTTLVMHWDSGVSALSSASAQGKKISCCAWNCIFP